MTVPLLARAVAKALAEEPLDAPVLNDARRERTIVAIRAELALREKRRTRRRWATIALVAAAVLLSAAGSWSIVTSKGNTNVASSPSAGATTPRGPGIVAEEVHGEVFLTTAGGNELLAAHGAVANEQGIVTGEGDVTLALGNAGTRVRIDPRSSAALTNGPDAGVVRVRSGAVTATVAKLRPNERFLIQTDEAEVEAHGTVFTVARATTPDCGARTSVHVMEGRISVRDKGGTLFLGPSEDWKSVCISGGPAPSAVPGTAPTPTPRPMQPVFAPSAPSQTSTLPFAPPSASPPPTSSVSPYPEFGRRK